MAEMEIYAPHPKQRAVMLCPAEEILYGGSAGSGKSFCIIFSWMQHEATNKKNAKGLVIRKTMSELEDLIREFQKVFTVLQQPPKWNETKKTFFFPSGATLELGYLDKDDDKYRYHGRQFSFIAWDELTLWKNDDPYRFLLTRLRSAAGVKVTVLSTTNPIGVGASWVKKRWKIDEFPGGMQPITQYIDLKSGEIFQDEKPEWAGQSDTLLASEGIRRWTRIFIPGKLSDNPTLDKGGAYRASLMMQPEKIRKALLEGRWDSIDGQFFHEWDPDVHVVPWFKPPEGYRRWMAMDWGTAKPYCCLWASEMPDGSVVIYDELYGQHPSGDPDRGTMENGAQVAAKIVERERSRDEFIHERYADPSIFADHGNLISIDKLFVSGSGGLVVFQPAGRRDKEARIALFRQFLTVTNKQSRLKIMSNCKNLIRTIPLMMFDEKNPEQYNTKLEDHCLSWDTPVLTGTGVKRISDIEHGDMVFTPVGWRESGPARKTGVKPTFSTWLSNGSFVRSTDNHKFLVAGKGFVPLTDIYTGDILVLGGGKYEPCENFRYGSVLQREELLSMWKILPKERGEAASGCLEAYSWANPGWFPCASQKWGQSEQQSGESRIDEWARSLVIAHDTGTEGVGEGEHQEGHCCCSSVAQIGSRKGVAQATREGVSGDCSCKNEIDAPIGVCVCDMPRDSVGKGEGIVLLQSVLPYMGPQKRYYGGIVTRIRREADTPVFDIEVQDAHCFMLWNGMFAHNCVDAALYLLGRNPQVVSGGSRAKDLNAANFSRYSGMGVW